MNIVRTTSLSAGLVQLWNRDLSEKWMIHFSYARNIVCLQPYKQVIHIQKRYYPGGTKVGKAIIDSAEKNIAESSVKLSSSSSQLHSSLNTSMSNSSDISTSINLDNNSPQTPIVNISTTHDISKQHSPLTEKYKQELQYNIAKKLEEYEKQGIIKSAKNGKSDYSPTKDAIIYFNEVMKGPLALRNNERKDNSIGNEGYFFEDDNATPQVLESHNYTCLTVDNIHYSTVILTTAQKHFVIAEKTEDGTYEAFIVLTSDKGDSPLAKGAFTTLLSLDQPISGNKSKGQYATSIIPPIIIKESDCTVHDEGTAYVNRPDIKVVLDTLKNISKRYESVPYNPIGITIEDLEEVSTLHSSLQSEKHNEANDPSKDVD